MRSVIPLLCLLVFSWCPGYSHDSQGGVRLMVVHDHIMTYLSGTQKGKIPDVAVEVKNEEIVSYTWPAHALKLEKAAIKKLEPLIGAVFFVMIGDRCIYSGRVYNDRSSTTYDGIVLKLPAADAKDKDVVTFELGYPSRDRYHGKDLRDSGELKQELKLMNKLRE